MSIYSINPLSDTRWDQLVAQHPRASVFHRRGWLEALARTYGYQPLVLTRASAGEPLRDGMVFCRVSSWITGTRLVSLPFADHCEPLLDGPGDCLQFLDWLRLESPRQGWKYVELRPLSEIQAGADLQPGRSYYFHELDIRPGLEQIFQGLHKDSIQRRIRRAEKEGLAYEVGRSQQLVSEFYRLLLITRRRHELLPQPRLWFRNLVTCMGDAVQIRVARKHGVAIAAMLTLGHRSSVVYKYGCSDEKFHNLGAMPFLFWRLIEESKASGAEVIDLGRSDLDNDGLALFKDRFGARTRCLTYYRYPHAQEKGAGINWDSRLVRRFFCVLPNPVFSTAGRVLYRHMG